MRFWGGAALQNLEPLVRAHAAWVLGEIGGGEGLAFAG